MFKIFGFGRSKTAETPRSQLPGEQGASTRQHTDIQRELVRVVLKDTMRLHGIPLTWLGCEVLALSGRARGDDMMVRLIVLKWHEPLLKFLPALQNELILGLDRFEPAIDHSKYVVSWQFARDCGCPHMQMPDADSWHPDGQPAPVPAVIPATTTSMPSPAPEQRPAGPSIVDWQSTVPGTAVAAKPKFDLPATERDIRTAALTSAAPAGSPAPAPAPAFAATEPSPLASSTAPATPPGTSPAKSKFDLPPSDMDHLPGGFAATEPSALR